MSEYTKQAEQFLKDTETEFSIRFLYTGPFFGGEKEIRDVFEFTLKNACGSYTSKFGDSIHNTERRGLLGANNVNIKKARHLGLLPDVNGRVSNMKANQTPPPTAYAVLAHLQKYDMGTFEDFCAEFGYNDLPLKESPRVHGIYKQCVLQYAGLRKIFTSEQMDQLQEIA